MLNRLLEIRSYEVGGGICSGARNPEKNAYFGCINLNCLFLYGVLGFLVLLVNIIIVGQDFVVFSYLSSDTLLDVSLVFFFRLMFWQL